MLFSSNHKLLTLAFCCLFAISSCIKEKPNPTPEPEPIVDENGSLKLDFRNKVESADLAFGTSYINAKGDSFTVSKFNYYISNIQLVMNDNSVFSETYSYHMVKHSVPSSGIITLNNVPPGSYKAVKFLLGVDSAHNVSGAQAGDLDPAVASDMYWSWNSGYIFLKLEGKAPKSGEVSKNIEYHIGGFSGTNKTQRSFEIGFGGTATNVSKSTTPIVELWVNAAELFKSPNTIDFTTQHTIVSAGANAKLMADNYADMISFKQFR